MEARKETSPCARVCETNHKRACRLVVTAYVSTTAASYGKNHHSLLFVTSVISAVEQQSLLHRSERSAVLRRWARKSGQRFSPLGVPRIDLHVV